MSTDTNFLGGWGTHEVDLNRVDFEYVQECSNVRELRSVIALLEKEPYPDLLLAAKKRVCQLRPSLATTYFRTEQKELDDDEVADLNSWVSKISSQDEELKTNDSKLDTSALPAIRGTVPVDAKPAPAVRKPNLQKAKKPRNKPKPKPTVVSRSGSTIEELSDSETESEPEVESVAAPPSPAPAVLDTVSGMSASAAYVLAMAEKTKGGDHFRAGEYTDSIRCYEKSVHVLIWLLHVHGLKKSADSVRSQFSALQSADALKTVCTDKKLLETNSDWVSTLGVNYSNLAVSLLRKGEYSSCENYCIKSIICDQDNPKTLYIMAQAQVKLIRLHDGLGTYLQALRTLIDSSTQSAGQPNETRTFTHLAAYLKLSGKERSRLQAEWRGLSKQTQADVRSRKSHAHLRHVAMVSHDFPDNQKLRMALGVCSGMRGCLDQMKKLEPDDFGHMDEHVKQFASNEELCGLGDINDNNNKQHNNISDTKPKSSATDTSPSLEQKQEAEQKEDADAGFTELNIVECDGSDVDSDFYSDDEEEVQPSSTGDQTTPVEKTPKASVTTETSSDQTPVTTAEHDVSQDTGAGMAEDSAEPTVDDASPSVTVTDKPVDKPTDKSADKPTDTSADTSAGKHGNTATVLVDIIGHLETKDDGKSLPNVTTFRKFEKFAGKTERPAWSLCAAVCVTCSESKFNKVCASSSQGNKGGLLWGGELLSRLLSSIHAVQAAVSDAVGKSSFQDSEAETLHQTLLSHQPTLNTSLWTNAWRTVDVQPHKATPTEWLSALSHILLRMVTSLVRIDRLRLLLSMAEGEVADKAVAVLTWLSKQDATRTYTTPSYVGNDPEFVEFAKTHSEKKNKGGGGDGPSQILLMIGIDAPSSKKNKKKKKQEHKYAGTLVVQYLLQILS